MATLSELTKILSQVTGIPEATVFAYGRFAREAGHITQGGRGRGGASMTYKDAANLLLAVCGTSVTREAGETIQWYRETRGWLKVPDRRNQRAFTRWLSTYDFRDGQNDDTQELALGSFLESVLRMAGTGALEEQMRRVPTFKYTMKLLGSLGDEHALEPDPWLLLKNGIIKPRKPDEIQIGIDVGLRLEFKRNHGPVSFDIRHVWGFERNLASFVFYEPPHKGIAADVAKLVRGESILPRDFKVTASISETTIIVLGLATAGKEIPDELLTDPQGIRRRARLAVSTEDETEIP